MLIIEQIFIKCLRDAKSVLSVGETRGNKVKTLLSCLYSGGGRLTRKKDLLNVSVIRVPRSECCSSDVGGCPPAVSTVTTNLPSRFGLGASPAAWW